MERSFLLKEKKSKGLINVVGKETITTRDGAQLLDSATSFTD